MSFDIELNFARARTVYVIPVVYEYTASTTFVYVPEGVETLVVYRPFARAYWLKVDPN